MKEEAQTNS